MKVSELIKQLLDENNVTYAEMARRVGEDRQAVWTICNPDRRNRKGTTTAKILKYLDVFGYTLAAVPKSYNLGKNCYVLEVENVGEDKDEESGSVS